MKYKVNEYVTATKALALYSPDHRTEGKAYKIKRVNQDSVDIWNDKDNYGTFSPSEMENSSFKKLKMNYGFNLRKRRMANGDRRIGKEIPRRIYSW